MTIKVRMEYISELENYWGSELENKISVFRN